MKTKEELLALFPDYKPTVYSSSLNGDFIIPVFTYYDRLELEGQLLDQYNKDNQQGLLFLS